MLLGEESRLCLTVFAVLGLIGATSIADLILVLTDLEVLCQGSDWLQNTPAFCVGCPVPRYEM